MTAAGALIAGLVFGSASEALPTPAFVAGGFSLLALAAAVAFGLLGANADRHGHVVDVELCATLWA